MLCDISPQILSFRLRLFWIVKEMHLPIAHAILNILEFNSLLKAGDISAIGSADMLSHVLVINWKSGLMNYQGCQRLVLLSHMRLILPLPMGYWADGLSCPDCCLVLVNGFLHWNRLFKYTCSLLCWVILILVMLRENWFHYHHIWVNLASFTLCMLSLSAQYFTESNWSPGLTPSGAKFTIYYWHIEWEIGL